MRKALWQHRSVEITTHSIISLIFAFERVSFTLIHVTSGYGKEGVSGTRNMTVPEKSINVVTLWDVQRCTAVITTGNLK